MIEVAFENILRCPTGSGHQCTLIVDGHDWIAVAAIRIAIVV